uniref:Negative elongation factor B n=1 Tax=Auxenochlorella protothecoides TaxID=3075 RepID=A0A1D1ZVX3_AUXPR
MATLGVEASVASGAQSGADCSEPPPPLVGQAGQEFVQNTLSTHDPLEAIAEIQRRGGLPDPRCAPLLGLLDQLGVSRSEACRHVLQSAMRDLLARVESMGPDALLGLLELSFPFVGLAELRAVPLAVLDRLHPVPASFLKQLTADGALFRELPLGVQRQVWDLDRKLLQAHALPLVLGYAHETATVLRALDMREAAAAAGKGGRAGAPGPRTGNPPAAPPALPRRILRRGSAALQRLTRMVGGGRQIYRGLAELCAARFRDGDALYVGVPEAALCTLRSQLLMALHDLGQAELCSRDPCHKLAWTLDACLMDKRLDSRRLQEIGNFFVRFEDHAPFAARAGSSRRGHRGAQQQRSQRSGSRAWEDDAESSGAPGASAALDPFQELGDAGMVLRDPSTLHLIVHNILQHVSAAVEEERQPKDDAELVLLTRLLQLAVGCRAGLRQGRVVYAEASPEIMTTLYPTLANLMLEAALRDPGEPIDSETEAAALETLTPLLSRSEAVRKVAQMFLLERLEERDLLTATLLLQTMAGAMETMTDKSIPEFAPFGFSLARQLTILLTEGAVRVEDGIWQLAVDRVLVKLVDSETAVHEEVLRLLLAASSQIPLLPLANYLHHTLSNSRKSRKRFKKRKLVSLELEPWSEYAGAASEPAYSDGYASAGYTSAGYASQGDDTEMGSRGADGIRATYVLFAQRVPGLNATTAPTLHAYLEAG